MAYTKQTWTDGVSPVNETRLGYIEQGIADAHGLAAAAETNGFITVASSEAPSGIRAKCDYVCSGSNDQVQINQALAQASRPNDGFGGEGRLGVALVGPRFYVGNNGTGAITMYPSTHLTGAGQGTVITPMWPTNVDRGCIELLNSDVAHATVSDLTIGRHNAVQSNGHGIKFVNNGSADQYEVKTGADPFLTVRNVMINQAARSGIYVTGTSGGCRETQVSHCLAWSCGERGFYIDSSDCQISDCRATGGGNYARYELAGGNVKIANCKSYFSGNRVGNGSTADGFIVSSSRIEIANCAAQDNGRYGFNFTGGDVSATALVADSNSRSTSSGAGFRIAADGMYAGLHGYNRPQTPSSPQNTAFLFSGSPQVYLTGRAGINNTTSGVYVSGSAGSNSYVRIVRDGSTIYSQG